METPPHVPSPAPSLPPLPSSPFSSPPLLPLLPSLLQWNPSYSSSLSALAPPFTLDHASPALHPSLQVPTYTPDPLLFRDFPSSVRLPPPHNEVSESLPSLSDSSSPDDADFSDWCCDAELHPEPRVKAFGNTVEPTIYSRFAAPFGTGCAAAAATVVAPFYSPYYPDSQLWNFNGHFRPLSTYYKHRTSLLFDGEASPAKSSDEVPLTEVTKTPFSHKAPSFREDRPSTSQLPPYNTAADSLPSGSINCPFGYPCYAHYYNDSEILALDDNFGPSFAHSELGVALRNKPSDEDLGSVKLPDELPGTGPPSSNGKLFLPRGKEHFEYQSTEWPPEKYEREQDSASSYSTFNPQLSTSAGGLNDPYVSGSAFDCYTAQLDSYSVYPEFYYPSFNWFTSNEVYLPSNFTASTNINPSLLSGKVHHEVLPMVDDASVIPSRSKEANRNENMDPKGEYNEKRWEDYNTTNSNVLPAVSRRGSLSSNNHATESPLNLPSMLTSKLRLGDMVIADSSPCGCNSLNLNKSSMSFSETFDQHNLSVDSPCWKGAPASQQSLFTRDEILLLEREIIKSHLCNEPNQIPEGVGDPNNSAEQVGNLNFDYIKKSHVSEKPECSPVVSSNVQQILEFSENKMSDCRKDQANEILFDYVLGEQTNQTIEAKQRVDAQHGFAAKFVEMESNAPNEFAPPKCIAKNNKGPSSTPLSKLEELVKLIHGSSVELLSTNCSKAEGLKPHDYKLLYAAISNISLLLKDKDIVGCSGLEVACSENMSSSRNQNYDTKRKTMSICDYFDDDSGNLVIKGGDKKMTQTSENALSQSFTESEESRQALLYKNLWVQAELLACRLKQQLVIAQMKTDSESHNPPRSDTSSNLNSLRDLKGHDLPLKTKDAESIREKESKFSASANHELSKAEDVESSLMAQFEILKDRNNKSMHRNAELDYILDQEHASMHPVVNADIYSSLLVEKNSPMTANQADMGFIESVAEGQLRPSFNVSGDENTRQMLSGQSCMTYKQGTCPSGSGNELDDQEHAAMQPVANANIYTSPEAENNSESVADVQVCPSFNVLGYGNTRQTLSGPLNGPLIQSYMTYKQGSCPSRSADEDLSFEWVHVMEEDESTQ